MFNKALAQGSVKAADAALTDSPATDDVAAWGSNGTRVPPVLNVEQNDFVVAALPVDVSRVAA